MSVKNELEESESIELLTLAGHHDFRGRLGSQPRHSPLFLVIRRWFFIASPSIAPPAYLAFFIVGHYGSVASAPALAAPRLHHSVSIASHGRTSFCYTALGIQELKNDFVASMATDDLVGVSDDRVDDRLIFRA